VLQALSVVLPPFWMASAVLHGMAFGGERAPQVEAPRRWTFLSALGLHLAWLVARGLQVGGQPVTDTWSTISTVAFAIALLYGWVAHYTRQAGTGGVVLGLVFLLQLAASAFGTNDPAPYAGLDAFFPLLHVATMVIAVAALVLSGIHGILYLVVFRRLRERRFGPLFEHLPDLEQLSRMTRRAALAGFLFSTVGLNVGIGLAHARGVQGFGYLDPQVLLTLVLWIHFGVIAFSGHIRGITARRASFAAAAGLVVLIASLFITLFPALTFHARG
jgi:ABC-type uncharacterized transport system permease subunit